MCGGGGGGGERRRSQKMEFGDCLYFDRWQSLPGGPSFPEILLPSIDPTTSSNSFCATISALVDLKVTFGLNFLSHEPQGMLLVLTFIFFSVCRCKTRVYEGVFISLVTNVHVIDLESFIADFRRSVRLGNTHFNNKKVLIL